jgi:hypothetical protein
MSESSEQLARITLQRTMKAATIAGIRAIVVHAIDEGAARFYERQGFRRSATHPLTLMMALKDAGALR